MSSTEERSIGGRSRCRGFSLVEVIMFIVIISVAVGGVMLMFAQTTRASADPRIRKQAVAIADSLLEEVRMMPFTFCDPDDPAVSTAGAPAACGTPEVVGPEAGETRYAALTPFDNVNDYNGFAMAGGILDITGTAIAGLGAYSATIGVGGIIFGGIPVADAQLITVTVTGPNTITVVLNGIRTRHAPNL